MWASCLCRHVRNAFVSVAVVAVSTSRFISFLRFGSCANKPGSTEMLIVFFPRTVGLSVNRPAVRTIASTSRFRYRFSNSGATAQTGIIGGLSPPNPFLRSLKHMRRWRYSAHRPAKTSPSSSPKPLLIRSITDSSSFTRGNISIFVNPFISLRSSEPLLSTLDHKFGNVFSRGIDEATRHRIRSPALAGRCRIYGREH